MAQAHWTTTSPKFSGNADFCCRGSEDLGRGRASRFRGLLLATTALAATALPAHAQTLWDGTSSGNWFAIPNWSAGVPTNATDAEIDTVANNLPRIEGSPASAQGLVVGNTSNGVLTIQFGGTLASQTGSLGQGANSNGSVAVIGDGAAWTISSSITVGNVGDGSLAIVNGGDVTSDDGNLGVGTAAFGSVIVTGAGSTWTDIGRVVVGGFGGATVNVENGAKVTTNIADIAHAAGSQGNIFVIGGGSIWESSGPLTVGKAGEAEMTIQDGGRVSAHHAFIAEAAGSSGEIVVSGGGSKWVSTGNFMVGLEGEGTVAVADGATVEIGHGVVGFIDGSLGRVTVVGDGSALSSSDHLFVGGDGTGELVVADGGLVHTTEGTLASAETSIGAAIVTGSGSAWTNDGLLAVANNGRADLFVENGGKLGSVGGNIARFLLGQGNVGVKGAGSVWENSDFLFVGGQGNGAMAIEDGGRVSNLEGSIAREAGSTGTVVVAGAGSRWTNASLFVGFEGSGALTIQESGMVTAQTAAIGTETGSSGTVTVTGQGSAWVNTDDLFVGGEGTGRLAVANGGRVEAGGMTFIGAAAGSAGMISIGAAAGLAPLAPGTLQTQRVAFGAGEGTLFFNHTAADYLFAPRIEGAGTIGVLSGTTLLTADSSGFTGDATIDDGATLVVDGKLGGSLVVLAGGRLEGSGTIGTTQVASGGTVSPGNSIGTLNVAGDIAFDAGSTYEVEVNPAGTEADLLHATGAATLNGGAVTQIGLDGAYKPFTTYTIVTADDGVAGTFGGVTSDFAFLNPQLSYDPNNVFLTLVRNDVSFCAIGVTSNQCATGDGVESLGLGSQLHDALVVLDEGTARNALDQLSGEIHASIKGAMLEDSRFVREAATTRVRSAFEAVAAPALPILAYGDKGPDAAAGDTDRLAVWTRVFGAWGQFDGDGNAAALDRSIGGMLVGGDALVFEAWRLGLLAGYSRSSFDLDDRASSGDSDNFHLGLYGGSQWGGLGLRFGAAYAWHDVETDRSVSFTGFTDTLEAGYDAGTAQVFGELGYRFDAPSVSLEPFGSLAYVNVDTDAFAETGRAAALAGARSNTDATFATLGLRASGDFMLSQIKATARGMLGWRHVFGDITPAAAFAFAGGDVFTIAGALIARDAAVVEAGIDLAITPQSNFGFSYEGQFGSGFGDHSAKTSLSVRF